MTITRQATPGTSRLRMLVRAPEQRVPERRYILDLILGEWLGLEYSLEPGAGKAVTLELAGDPRGRQLSIPDTLLGTSDADWLTPRCLPRPPLPWVEVPLPAVDVTAPRALSRQIPVLYGAPGGCPAWTETPAGLTFTVDVFGTAFFLLSRMEEVVASERDRHDRFPAGASIASIEGILNRPLVDECVDLLEAGLTALWPGFTRPRSEFRLRLTHDIDRPWSVRSGQPPWIAVGSAARDLVRRREPALAARRLRAIADARNGRYDRDPLNTFDFLMRTSERHGLRSTFYFMAGGRQEDYDFRYRLSDPAFAPILRAVHERGHEIGLHASYMSYRSAVRMKAEASALIANCRAAGVDQPEWGVRQHYLRFANPETWRHHEAAGLKHDSSIGFAEQVGFRSGTCREHPVFDLRDGRTLPLRERPLVVMDATLFGYLGLRADEAARRARAVVEVCRRHGGDAVVLYHNDSVVGSRRQAHYRELVEELVRPA